MKTLFAFKNRFDAPVAPGEGWRGEWCPDKLSANNR